ncbi:MAG: PrgI family protein [Candidatus Pacebacteria bacterium]|nr:PrgI family protein [Candidatus Paceibacterota bacterium]
MEQHPIPQQISAYQFRLIGDMTLRQFSQLAGGLVLALFFYVLPIPGLFKWFFVLLFGLLGFALAFLPLEDRPLDQWLTAFINSIYTPTMFVWRKEKRLPAFLADTPGLRPISQTATAPATQLTQANLLKYLNTLSPPASETEAEKEETAALSSINNLFASTKLPPTITPEPKRLKITDQLMPQLKIKPRKLSAPPSEAAVIKIGFPPTAKKTSLPAPPTQEKKKPKSVKLPRIKISPSKPRKDQLRVQAKTSTELPIPNASTQPNIIVGMVLNREGKIVENAIIEIRDREGLPVRALRTNRLGQFQIVTPLSNGTYEIEVEKEELVFDIIKLNLTGEIVPPIEIRAK